MILIKYLAIENLKYYKLLHLILEEKRFRQQGENDEEIQKKIWGM
jgi:hypothetical protein